MKHNTRKRKGVHLSTHYFCDSRHQEVVDSYQMLQRASLLKLMLYVLQFIGIQHRVNALYFAFLHMK